MITLGHIAYSNVYPVHGGLLAGAVEHPFRIVRGLPSQLNRLLARGAVDVCAASSITYARDPGAYVLLPDLAIASDGPVRSIVLISRVPLAALEGRDIAVTTASATSVVLLRILLRWRYGVAARLVPMAPDLGTMLQAAPAALLIGDDAMVAARAAEGLVVRDLGADWRDWTGLPMVFALWHVRREVAERDPARLAAAHAALRASQRWGQSDLPRLAERFSAELGFSVPALVDYWSGLTMDLGPREEAGLRRFYALAAELGEIAAVPAIQYWQADVVRESVSQ